MAQTGLSLAQFAVLRNIARREPVPLMELAGVLVMDRTTLYRALKPLEREGWIVVQSGQGRAKSARLSARGHEAVAASRASWQEAQVRLLDKFGHERWQMVEAALQDLVAISQEEMR